MTSPSTTHGMFRCVCGKMAYPDKASAKAAKKRLHPHDGGIRPYYCDQGLTRVWHLGHQTADRAFYREMRASAG